MPGPAPPSGDTKVKEGEAVAAQPTAAEGGVARARFDAEFPPLSKEELAQIDALVAVRLDQQDRSGTR